MAESAKLGAASDSKLSHHTMLPNSLSSVRCDSNLFADDHSSSANLLSYASPPLVPSPFSSTPTRQTSVNIQLEEGDAPTFVAPTAPLPSLSTPKQKCSVIEVQSPAYTNVSTYTSHSSGGSATRIVPPGA